MLALALGPLYSHPFLAISKGAEDGLTQRHFWYQRTLCTHRCLGPALPYLSRGKKYIYIFFLIFLILNSPLWHRTGGEGRMWREEWGSLSQQRSPPPLKHLFLSLSFGECGSPFLLLKHSLIFFQSFAEEAACPLGSCSA